MTSNPELAAALELAARSAVGLLLTEPTGRISFANPAALELLGCSLEELLAPVPLEHWVPESHLAKVRAEMATRARGSSLPYRTGVRRRSGEIVELCVRPTPLFSREGEFQGSLVLIAAGHGKTVPPAHSAPQAARNGKLAAPSHPVAAGAIENPPSWQDLSPRERQIAQILVQGRKPAEIALRLGLSVHTVRSHLRLMYRKLGVHSQLEFASRLLEPQRRGA